MNVKYTSGRRLNVSFCDFENNIVDYPNLENISVQFNKLMSYVNSLKCASSIVLDINSKLLVEIYKTFYNENPDFSSKNISIEI